MSRKKSGKAPIEGVNRFRQKLSEEERNSE